MKSNYKKIKREARRARIRAKISGRPELPRLSVFRSNTSMFLQLIDDSTGRTIASAHTKEIKSLKDSGGRKGKTAASFELGKLIAEKAKGKKIDRAVFDRGGYRYHGRVRAAAEGAREGGLYL